MPLTVRFRDALAHIGAQSTPRLQRIWAALPGYDEANIAQFEREVAAILATAKNAAVAHSGGYYALLAGVRPPPLNADAISVEADTRGPFIQTWSALSNTGDEEGAIAAGASRVEAMVTNYISSSSRLTGDAVYQRADVGTQGWVREPEPGACDWCLEAATTTYSSSEATDFGHDRCQCIGVPAF